MYSYLSYLSLCVRHVDFLGWLRVLQPVQVITMSLFNITGAYKREGAYFAGGEPGGESGGESEHVLKLLILKFPALYEAISVPLSRHLANVLSSDVCGRSCSRARRKRGELRAL